MEKQPIKIELDPDEKLMSDMTNLIAERVKAAIEETFEAQAEKTDLTRDKIQSVGAIACGMSFAGLCTIAGYTREEAGLTVSTLLNECYNYTENRKQR